MTKNEDITEFYNQFIDKVTCAYRKDIFLDEKGFERCRAKRTEQRDKYLFKGLTDEVVLIECPSNLLALEFETHNNKSGIEKKEVSKEKIKEWIKQTVENAKNHRIDYCVCDHGGTSPWFYACNFSNLIENKEKDCKKEIAKLIVPKEAIDFLDYSNLGSTLIPIMEKPHWKFNKYNGAVHKIVEGTFPTKQDNKLPDIIIQRVIDNERPNFPKIQNYGESDINSIPLTKVISTIGLKKRGQEYGGSNVWHGSSTGLNFFVNPSKNCWFCFRCNSGGGVPQAIALNKGIITSCDQNLTGDKFKQVLEIAREEYGLKKPEPITPKKNFEEFTLDKLQREEETKNKIARISGKLHDGTFYWTIPVSHNDKYYFVVLTENRNKLLVKNRGLELQQDKLKRIKNAVSDKEKKEIENEEIPQEEEYLYFDYEGYRYKFPEELFWKDSFEISAPSKEVLSLIENKINKKELWSKLFNNLKKYFDHSEEDRYSLLLPFPIMSYLQWGICSTYYEIIQGAEDTGKSTLQIWNSLVEMYGYFCGKSSLPFAVRLLHFFGIALNQDEFEKMHKDEKRTAMGVFNSGLSVSGTYNFVNTNKKRIEDQMVSLRTFGTKSFSMNTEVLDRDFDKSFISRCDIVIGSRKNRETQDIRKLEEAQVKEFQDLRNELFVYCLTNFKAIEKDIQEVKETLESEGIFGRRTDVNSLILGIIKHFKGDYTAEKKHLEGEQGLIKIETSGSTKDVILFSYLSNLFSLQSQTIEVTNKDIANHINETLGLPDGKKINPRTIGALLRRSGLVVQDSQARRTEYGYKYEISLSKFKEMAKRFNHKEAIDTITQLEQINLKPKRPYEN